MATRAHWECGGNAVLRFVQSALAPSELDRVTLIENIHGSEKWDVRDLFQRDVDHERVTSTILPYLKDRTKVKFFNPLTLVLLPMTADGHSVESDLHLPEKSKGALAGTPVDWEERPSFFRFSINNETAAFSAVEWSDLRVKIVAIDGQHRLSALKRWWNEPSGQADLSDWTIPVVFVGVFRENKEKPAPNLLEVVRKTFVYINSTAANVNEARRILLDDESIIRICAQELVQASHVNDCKNPEERVVGRIPLLFFDWRGETRNKERVYSAGSVKTIEEVASWLKEYLLGEDGSPAQSEALDLDDLIPPLEAFGPDRKLSHVDAVRIRTRFGEDLLPALQHLLEKFAPYASYIAEVEKLERRSLMESDYAKFAFMKLKFGNHRAGEEILGEVNAKYLELERELGAIKSKSFDQLLALDIGMRAVVYAFAEVKKLRKKNSAHQETWLDYAKLFVSLLDEVYAEKWFSSFEKLSRKQSDILMHVAYDPAGTIINYRLEDQGAALGAVVALLVVQRIEDAALLESAWGEWGDALRGTAQKSIKKQVRAKLRGTFTGTPAAFNAKVSKEAEKLADSWQKKLAAELELSPS